MCVCVCVCVCVDPVGLQCAKAIERFAGLRLCQSAWFLVLDSLWDPGPVLSNGTGFIRESEADHQLLEKNEHLGRAVTNLVSF